MAKTTYLATDAAGTVHTRKTDRVYTHTVVARNSKSFAVGQANARVAYHTSAAREQFKLGAASIDEIKAWLRAKRCEILCRDDVYATKRQAEGQAFAVKWGTAEAYAAARLTEELARIEATDWTLWQNLGWCGRPDLADKLCAKSIGPRYAAVAVLDAERK